MEKKNVEKEKSELIADAISKIEKQYGKGSIIKFGRQRNRADRRNKHGLSYA